MTKKDFEPSRQTLLRILKTIIDNESTDKTDLSMKANINYARLKRHIVWLEKKGFVKSIIEKQKINIQLTESGRKFYDTLANGK